MKRVVMSRGWLVVVGGCVIWSLLGCDLSKQPLLVRWFGPPQKKLHEAYVNQKTGEMFSHTTLHMLLLKVLSSRGFVDYPRLLQEKKQLQRYLKELEGADFRKLSRDGKLAFLLNAYNACTLALILERYPLKSIKAIPSAERWKAVRWKLGGLGTLSLEQIEHDFLRKNFFEPRIHFAINCASTGCPPIRREAYRGEKIGSQLEEQTRLMHQEGPWLRWKGEELHLTRLYLWYKGDFVQKSGSVLNFVAQYNKRLARILKEGKKVKVVWMPYDWSLNQAKTPPASIPSTPTQPSPNPSRSRP